MGGHTLQVDMSYGRHVCIFHVIFMITFYDNFYTI